VPMAVYKKGSTVVTVIEGNGAVDENVSVGGPRIEISSHSNIVLDRRLVVLDVRCLGLLNHQSQDSAAGAQESSRKEVNVHVPCHAYHS
jgi:hypothetical protein